MIIILKAIRSVYWITKRYILSFFNQIIPKSDKIILIHDERHCKDNVWAISEFLSKNDEYNKYNIFYYTKGDKSSNKNLKVISNKIYAFWIQLRAKYIFYSYREMTRIKPTKNQIVLDTMHGSPLKNVGYLVNDSRLNKFWGYEKDLTYILCVSDFFKEIIKKCFRVTDEQCLVLGYPRNDYIFSKENVLQKLGVNPKEYNKILLWMPTWRGHSRTGINTQSESEFPIINMNNIKRLDQYTREKNVLLMIKPHPIQLNLSILNENFQNIKVIKNKDLDDANMFLYQLFHEVDALLTDYSSVYFDFLLTMKPIGFTIDDFGSYMDKRGFVVDNPLDIMPGEKITTIDELFKFINDVIEGNDKFYEERKRINDLANKYKDGDSTKRIIEFLEL